MSQICGADGITCQIDAYGGQTSAFTPGTKANKYAKGGKVVFMKQDQAEIVARLAKEYTQILGF
jgi:hypothetical protein